MNRRRFILPNLLVAAIAGATVSAGAGCTGGRDEAAEEQAKINRRVAELQRGATWEEAPVSMPQEPTSVAQGKSPVIYLFDIGGPIAVIDLTTQTRLVEANIPNQTLIRVDDRNGVTVGKERLYPGPLAEGHEYGIFALPATPGVIRQGIGAPGDRPRQ